MRPERTERNVQKGIVSQFCEQKCAIRARSRTFMKRALEGKSLHLKTKCYFSFSKWPPVLYITVSPKAQLPLAKNVKHYLLHIHMLPFIVVLLFLLRNYSSFHPQYHSSKFLVWHLHFQILLPPTQFIPI